MQGETLKIINMNAQPENPVHPVNAEHNNPLQKSPHLLIDRFGRKVDYIRLSITDRCDFRCVYCMSEDMTFLPRDEVLSLEESARLVKVFVALGVHKVRITGGEPLVRKNAMSLFNEIGHLSGLDELVITTNGSQLEQYAAVCTRRELNALTSVSIASMPSASAKSPASVIWIRYWVVLLLQKLPVLTISN